jgi:uncharacterized protein (TIRG00374 family)
MDNEAVNWVQDNSLYLVLATVRASVSVAGAFVVALTASLLTIVPFTPSGLGFAEAGLVIMPGWLGLDAPTATAVTMLYRAINYWSIVVFGFLLYIFGRNGDRQAEERLGAAGVSIKNHKFFIGRS